MYKGMNISMIKIGILTFYSSINYGAFLQAYALQKYLQEYGAYNFEVEILAYETQQAHDTYERRIYAQRGKNRKILWIQKILFLKDRQKMYLSKKKLISDDIQEFCRCYYGEYDILIFGSDEIWRTDGFRSFPNVYWGNYSLGKTQYMSYACSSRSALSEMSECNKRYVTEALEHFRYVGGRDEYTIEEVTKIFMKPIRFNCDPTFLVDFPRSRKSRKKKRRLRLGLMISDQIIVDRLIEELNNKYEIVVFYSPNGNLIQDKSYVGPFGWTKEISKCDLVITNFFHATVFAIKFVIPFIAISYEDKLGKIEDLVRRLDMCERLVLVKEIRDNEFRRERLIRKILAIEKEKMDENYFDKVSIFLQQQIASADDFLAALNQVIKEIG